MSDYIDRQAAIDALKGLPTWWGDSGGYYGVAQPPMAALLDPEDAVSAIENITSADVEPVRHGRWIYGTDDETGEQDIVAWTCSLCGEKTPWQPRYCMHCGARMDGEADG